jgi:DNA-binding SARP family transcriptional activator
MALDAEAAPTLPEQHTPEELTQLESTCLSTPPNPAPDGLPRALQLFDAAPVPVNTQSTAGSSSAHADVEDQHDVPSVDAEPASVTAAPDPGLRANATPTPAQRLLSLQVLGRVRLVLHDDVGTRELSGALTPKQRELLVYLSLHAQGVRREALNDAVWPDSRPPRPFNSLHNALSLLRRNLNTETNGAVSELVLNDDGRYQLDTNLVTTDLAQFQQARRTADDGDPVASLRAAVGLYDGDLAEDLTASWVEPFREAIRRDVLDTLGVLIRAHGDSDPETMLVLLERTRTLDRYNELVYRDIIRTQARLGQYDAIPRTLALLAATLDDIGQRPDADTLRLADFLQRRATRRSATSDNAAAS